MRHPPAMSNRNASRIRRYLPLSASENYGRLGMTALRAFSFVAVLLGLAALLLLSAPPPAAAQEQKLSNPTGLKLTPGHQSLTLTWDARPSLNHFIRWSVPGSGVWGHTTGEGGVPVVAGQSSYTITGLESGQRYAVHLSASRDGGSNDPDDSDWVKVFGAPSDDRTFSIADASAKESNSAVLTVSLGHEAPAGGLTFNVTPAYATGAGKAAAADVGDVPATVRVAPGELTATLSIPLRFDREDEGDETFTVAIATSAAGWRVDPNGASAATVTIVNAEEPTPTGLKLTPGDGTLTLTWDPQPDFHHSVRWSVPGSGVWSNPRSISAQGSQDLGVTIDKGVSTYEITGLENDQRYAVHLRSFKDRPLWSQGDWVRVFGTPMDRSYSITSAAHVLEGGRATLTVTLGTTAPQGGLTFTVTPAYAAGAGQATAADVGTVPATVTVPAGQRTAALTVPILSDTLRDEGDETFTVTIATSAEHWYAASAGADTATVTIRAPGVTVTPQNLSAGEGATAAYDVVLKSRPGDAVRITPISSDPGAARSSGVVSFSPLNWDRPQTITLYLNQDDDDQDESATISHTASSNDPAYHGIAIASVTVTIDDDDAPGVAMTPARLPVVEGAAGQYTVALTTPPAGDVTVTPSSDAPVTFSPASRTFTAANWKTPQSFTVTTVVDDNIKGEIIPVVHTAASSADSDYNGLAVTPGVVAITDVTGRSLATLSGLTLSAAPRGFGFASATTDYAVRVHNSVTATTVTATALHPGANLRSGAQGALTAAVSGVASGSIPLNVGDNVIQVVATAEDGSATATYTVTVKRETPSEAVPRNLRLIPGSGRLTLVWEHADPTQAPSSAPVDGYRIRWSVPGSGVWLNPNGSGVGQTWLHSQPAEYAITGLDNYTEYAVHIQALANGQWVKALGAPRPLPAPTGMALTPGDRELTVSWDASADHPYHAIRWRAGASGPWLNPAGGSIAGNAANGVAVEPGTNSYTITGLDIGTDYEVQLKARPDSGHGESAGSASTAGTAWVKAVAAPVAGQTFSLSGATAREGDDARLTVTLSQPAPAGGVTFDISTDFSGTASQADVGHGTPSVTVAAGQRSAAFTIPIASDGQDEQDESFDVIVAAMTSGWTAAAPGADTAAVTITGSGILLSPDALTVAEGTTAGYAVALASRPTHDVTLTLASSDTGAVTVSPGTLTFTPADWRTPQSATVAAVRDGDANDESATITHTAASADPSYAGAAATLTVAVTEAGHGVAVSPTALTVAEGDTGKYAVSLTGAPTHDVVVTPASNDTSAVTVSGALTFTPQTWSAPQPVTVTAVSDSDEDSESVAITHAVTSDDANYGGGAAPEVTVAVTDLAAQSSDADLSALALSAAAGDIGFASATAVYALQVHHAVTSTTVTASARHPEATMAAGLRGGTAATLTNGVASAPISLSAGQNVIEVVVTAKNGDEKTYTVAVFREVSRQIKPRNVRLLSSSGLLTLFWDPAVADPRPNYSVRWSLPGSGQWLNPNGGSGKFVPGTAPTEYTISGLENGKEYAVQIKAGASTQNPWVKVSGTPAVLPPPTGVTLTPGNGTLTVTWDAPAGEMFHAIRWDCASVSLLQCPNAIADSINGNQLNGILIQPGVTGYTITGLDNKYEYRVGIQARPSTGWGEALGGVSYAGSSWVGVNGQPSAAPGATFSLAGSAVREGGDARLTVSLSQAAPEGGVAFSIATDFSGSASADDAGDAPAGVTVPAGQRRASFIIPILRDAATEDDETFTVTVATAAAGWSAVSAVSATATVTISDGPSAKPEVSFADAAIEVNEDAGTVTATVQVAGYNPRATEVTVAVADGTATDGTAARRGQDYGGPAAYTFFLPPGRDVFYKLTIPVTDDASDEENETFTMTITQVSDSHSAGSPHTATVTIVDNEGSAVTVSPTSLDLTEGGTADYTVVLTSKPAGNVTITPSSADTGAVSFTPASRVFTPDNWSTAQTFTATAVADADTNDESVAITHQAASADAQYGGAAVSSVAVTVSDTTAQTFSIAGVTVAESEDAMLTLTLSDPEHSAAVPFTVAVEFIHGSPLASLADLGTPVPNSVTVPAGQATVEITIPINDDPLPEGDEVFTVTVSTTADRWQKAPNGAATATVTITDDDVPGVTVTAANPLLASEGSPAEYTIVLNTRPAGNVTITPRSSNPSEARTSGVVTFTPSEWNTPKKIFIYPAEDDDSDNESVVISHVASSTDAEYGSGLSISDVNVSITDRGAPGVTVTAANPLTMAEGGSAEYTIVLNSNPVSDVTITPSSSDPDAVSTSGRLTFKSAEWDTPQKVTVSAAADDDNFDERVTISHVASGAAGYGSSLAIASVNVSVTDDEAKASALALSVANATVAEDVGSVTVTAKLDHPAGRDGVAVTLSATGTASETGDYALPAAFTIAGGRTAATAQVTIVDDGISEADETISLTAATTADGIDVTGAAVAITITDNDAAGVTVSAPVRLDLDEGGTAQYTVVLNNRPASGVTVTPTLTPAGIATVTPAAVSFDASNWQRAQTFTVTGAEDADNDNEFGAITHAVTGDALFAGLTLAPLTVAVADDEDSGDAALSGLALSAVPGGFGFTPAVPVYTLSVHNSVASTTVTATGRHPDATIRAGLRGAAAETLTSGAAGSSLALEVGQNIIDVVVTADDGATTKTYTIAVVREQPGPGVPRSVRLIPGDGTLTLIWNHADPSKAPSSHANDAYKIRWSVPGSGRWSNRGGSNGQLWFHQDTTKLSISGLTNGQEYAVHIRATDRTLGEGPWVKVFGTPAVLSVPVEPSAGKTFSINSPAAREGDDARLTIALGEAAPAGGLTFHVTPDFSGSASAADVGPAPFTVTAAEGRQSVSCTIPIILDQAADDGETFTVTVAAQGWTAAAPGADTATVTIADRSATAPQVSFETAAVEVSEDAGTATLTVRVSGEDHGAAEVTMTIADGAATAGEDYVAAGKLTLWIPTGHKGYATASFAIPVTDDQDVEENETFTVTITEVSAAHAIGSPDTATVTITDDDTMTDDAGVTVTATLNDAGKLEVAEDGSSTYTIVLDAQPAASVTVTPTSSDPGAARTSGAVTFAPAQWNVAKQVTVQGVPDADTDAEVVTITHQAASVDSSYNGIAVDSVAVAVTDTGAADVKSSDATLKALELTGGDGSTVAVSLAPGKTSYSVRVVAGDVTITPTTNHAEATVNNVTNRRTSQAFPVANGAASVPISLGFNWLQIVVTAEDGSTTATYTLFVSGVRPPSNDATLSALTVSDGTNAVALAPAFAAATTEYTASVANAVASVTVTPTVNDSKATVTVAGSAVNSGSTSGAVSLDVGSNAIAIVVTAPDATTKTYTVTVTRAAPDTSQNVVLSRLALGNAVDGSSAPTAFTVDFSGDKTNYFAVLLTEVTSVTVTASLAVPSESTSITVALEDDTTPAEGETTSEEGDATPETVSSGSPSSAITVHPKTDRSAPNVINVVVTNGSSVKTYAIEIYHADPVSFGSATMANQVYTVGARVDGSTRPLIQGPEASGYQVSYSATGLPAGLEMTEDRVIRGTPTATTASPVTVTYTAADPIGSSASLTFTVQVMPPVVLAETNIATVEYTIGQANPLSVLLPEASGGEAPLTYHLELNRDGSALSNLGGGINFDAATRTIAGRGTTPASAAVTYYVKDANGAIAATYFDIHVAPAPTLPAITDRTFAAGLAVSGADAQLPKAEGGSQRLRSLDYWLSPLPEGIDFDPRTRTLSGTPTSETAASTTVTYTATDRNGVSASATFDINIAGGVKAPEAPTLTATVRGPRVFLDWPDSARADRYVVQVKIREDGWPADAVTSAPGDVHIILLPSRQNSVRGFITRLTPGVAYDVRAGAVNDAGVAWSNVEPASLTE